MSKQNRSVRVEDETWNELKRRNINISKVINDALVNESTGKKSEVFKMITHCPWCQKNKQIDDVLSYGIGDIDGTTTCFDNKK